MLRIALLILIDIINPLKDDTNHKNSGISILPMSVRWAAIELRKAGCNFGWYLDYVPGGDVPNPHLRH